MNVRYYILSAYSVQMMFGMMQEALLPLSGEKILFDELPAEIYLLLKSYSTFKMPRHNYCMSNDSKILAVDGAGPSVKLFRHNNQGDYKHLQDISSSTYPAVHPLGNALAVIRTGINDKHHIDYYNREPVHGGFIRTANLSLDEPVDSISFSKDGSTLQVSVLVGTNTYEERQYIKTDHNTLVRLGAYQKMMEFVATLFH